MSEANREFLGFTGLATMLGFLYAGSLQPGQLLVTPIAMLGLLVYLAAMYLFRQERWYCRLDSGLTTMLPIVVGLMLGDGLWLEFANTVLS